jgi:hypothetical protein
MTTGLITPTTRGQEEQLKKFSFSAVKSARKMVVLDKESIDRLLKNGGRVIDDIIASFVNHSSSDDRFQLLSYFELTVPRRYNHGTQLATFASFAKKIGFDHKGSINDQNFAKTTHQLIPGKTYGAKIFRINRKAIGEDCLAFYIAQRALLVGVQGLSLAWQLKRNKFPAGRWTASFDREVALSELSYYKTCIVPCIGQCSGNWKSTLGYFGSDWSGHCIICFYDLDA